MILVNSLILSPGGMGGGERVEGGGIYCSYSGYSVVRMRFLLLDCKRFSPGWNGNEDDSLKTNYKGGD